MKATVTPAPGPTELDPDHGTSEYPDTLAILTRSSRMAAWNATFDPEEVPGTPSR